MSLTALFAAVIVAAFCQKVSYFISRWRCFFHSVSVKALEHLVDPLAEDHNTHSVM